MASAQEELAPIADASALQVSKSAQAGFSFLSLPPEIRNMIYHYIFTPVRDGTCWTIYANIDASVVKGFRRRCRLDFLAHDACLAEYKAESGGLHTAFGIANNYTHSRMIFTCRTVFGEAMPIAFSHMHIHVDSDFTSIDSNAFERFLANMRQAQGAYLSKLAYTYYPHSSNVENNFIQCINRSGIRIGYLGLHDCFYYSDTSRNILDPLKHFVNMLDGLDHQPARVEWTALFDFAIITPGWESRRAEFNTAVQLWREQLAVKDAASLNAQQTRLRDFLPQYFDQSSD